MQRRSCAKLTTRLPFWILTYDRGDVMVCSIHCHPDYDYPFHSGSEDENAKGKATFHVPLKPGATWTDHYQPALERSLSKIFGEFGAQALVVSMGLDTLQGDPVTLRRAGFAMGPNDYKPMGRLSGCKLSSKGMPCLVVQEGGYKMDQVG
ncbi:Acetylpolyamine amidohydrolase [Seminavis robusta]|uniref:Acetylpolyamine amidohydrolase n=1 Tax=Seminavis robusta TaxID=568900 RepID=A0A9N8ELC8_9STRA|nr:Acetylpolyamine amidohydrolase [Seminavis robusta]|eukprot:Sro1472_g275460.1 Acetylpolyamine amidohydrolase (150) ;mRNA; r:1626-2075